MSKVKGMTVEEITNERDELATKFDVEVKKKEDMIEADAKRYYELCAELFFRELLNQK
tara:strand:+ start:820 stop:993 length:174 start_codon:yes stop_codon:yes gene_type:complete